MAYRMTPARRAALRKAQAASARKRRKSGRSLQSKINTLNAVQALDRNTANRRARVSAMQKGKRPTKRSARSKIHSAGKVGATYGGLATLSGKGMAVGYAAGAAVGAAGVAHGAAKKRIRKIKTNRAKVKARAR